MIDTDLQEYAAARAAVETMLYDIEDELHAARDRLMAHATNGVRDFESAMMPAVGRLYEYATWPGPFDDGADPVEWAPVLRLNDGVRIQLDAQAQDIGAVADRAMDVTAQNIASILPSTSEIFSTIVKVFGNLIDGLLGALSNNSEFWATAASVLGNEVETHHDKVSNTLSIIANAVIATANEKSADPGEVSRRLQEYLSRPPTPRDGTVESYIALLQAQPRFITNLANVATSIAGVFEWLSARNSAFISGVRQAAFYGNPTTPLSVSNLVGLLRTKKIGEGFAHEHAKRSGYSPELFDLLRSADERLLDTQPILELWRRSGDDSVLDELYRLGYSQESVAALRTIALAVATPSDVVRFLVRDVFDQGAITRGKLDEDFDIKYNEQAFREAGVSKQLALYYWMAHWQLPSPTQGYQMLHRGVLTMPELQALIKQADYAPGYVDKLIAISYNVPGRIDVRRMYETGIITTDDELESYYKMMGYSPEHAVILRDFTKRLKGISDEGKADRRYGRIATAIVRAFVVGSLSELRAKQAIIQLGFSEERAAIRLAEGEYARQTDRADRIRDVLGDRYVRGFLTEEATRGLLEGYGFDAEEVEYLFHGWQLERELRGETDEQARQKDLSKSEIIAAYTDGLITSEDAAANLTRLGYDGAESSLLLQLADAKEARAESKALEASIRTQYLNRKIEADAARQAIQQIGYTLAKQDALLERWTIEREERRPDISPAQLERMLMQGIIPIEDIERRLLDRGYTEADANALLTLYGTDMSIAEEKLRAQQDQFRIREERLARQGDRRLDLTERGQGLQTDRFNAQQAALQQRFEAGQEERARLQTERLEAGRALQAERIAAQTERDAQALAAARERQANQIAAQQARLDTQIAAADKRAADALAARQEAIASRERLAQQAREARDAQQTRNLEAQAARQQRSIDAADRRASDANALRQALQDQKEAATVELTQLRSELTALRDIRQEAARVRQLGRQEQVRIRTEDRAAARREIASSDAAALQAGTQAIALQQASAIADVNARFAALQAQIAANRERDALARRQAAERALAAATPATTLLDSVL